MYFFSIRGTYKILSAILLFNSNFFQSLLVDGKSISFQLYCSMKGLILDILSGYILFFYQDLMLKLQHIENIYNHYFLDLLLISYFFYHFGESIYDPPLIKLILLKS